MNKLMIVFAFCITFFDECYAQRCQSVFLNSNYNRINVYFIVNNDTVVFERTAHDTLLIRQNDLNKIVVSEGDTPCVRMMIQFKNKSVCILLNDLWEQSGAIPVSVEGFFINSLTVRRKLFYKRVSLSFYMCVGLGIACIVEPKFVSRCGECR
jgi:hypothetical protein